MARIAAWAAGEPRRAGNLLVSGMVGFSVTGQSRTDRDSDSATAVPVGCRHKWAPLRHSILDEIGYVFCVKREKVGFAPRMLLRGCARSCRHGVVPAPECAALGSNWYVECVRREIDRYQRGDVSRRKVLACNEGDFRQSRIPPIAVPSSSRRVGTTRRGLIAR
jgi:hypothetical protein